MSRSYTLRNLADEKGRPLANVWCRAFNASTGALVETEYTDSAGACTFDELPNTANVNICAVWGDNAKWFYNVFIKGGEILLHSNLVYINVYDVNDVLVGTISSGAANYMTIATQSGKILTLSGYPINLTSVGVISLISDVGIDTYQGTYIRLPAGGAGFGTPAAEGHIIYDYVNHVITYHNGTTTKTVATV